MFQAIITLIAALWLSTTAAYFSIYGLTALFPGAFWSIVIMGGGIEFAKVVAATWIHRNWFNTKLKPVMKYYLVFGILTMMLLTSTGIFGYLSQCHLETTSVSDQVTIQSDNIQNQINTEQNKVDASNKELGILDKSLDVYLNNNKATAAVHVKKDQEAERKQLNQTINDSQKHIDELKTELIPLKQQESQNSVKLGPIKYVAELIFTDYQSHMDTAVRIVIMMLIFVFDPMAILLILASGISFADHIEKRKNRPVKPTEVDEIEILSEEPIIPEPEPLNPVIEATIEPEKEEPPVVLDPAEPKEAFVELTEDNVDKAVKSKYTKFKHWVYRDQNKQ